MHQAATLNRKQRREQNKAAPKVPNYKKRQSIYAGYANSNLPFIRDPMFAAKIATSKEPVAKEYQDGMLETITEMLEAIKQGKCTEDLWWQGCCGRYFLHAILETLQAAPIKADSITEEMAKIEFSIAISHSYKANDALDAIAERKLKLGKYIAKAAELRVLDKHIENIKGILELASWVHVVKAYHEVVPVLENIRRRINNKVRREAKNETKITIQ